MPKEHNIFQILLNAAIFISLEIAALAMLTNTNSMQNFFLTKATHHFMAKVWGGSESIKNYFSLKKTNDQLAQDNFRLREELKRYQNFETSIAISRKMQESIKGLNQDEFKYIPATIVKLSRNKQHNFLILGQGSNDGVKEGSGVITDNGVIGIVDAVSKNYSYAISFMNTEFNLSARIGKDGPIGPLNWSGKKSDQGILKEIPLQHKFSPGDTVYTSGYSSIFPAGIPVGTIGASRIVNGATYEIKIQLLTDPGAVRYVTVVNCVGKEEMNELEAAATHKD